MLRRRTSGHSGANTGPGRSQLLIQAFQASNWASWSKPGKSVHSTGTQRLLRCSSTGPIALAAVDVASDEGGVGADVGLPLVPGAISGTLLQAPSKASIPADIGRPTKSRRKRSRARVFIKRDATVLAN